MKILIKFIMLALSIIQIDAYAISNAKILNTYRPFSTPEKKQQFQTRNVLWPWASLVLTTGIGAGFFNYHVFSSTKISKQGLPHIEERYTYAEATKILKSPRRNGELRRIPTLLQTIGIGMKYAGIITAIPPFIHGMYTGNKESFNMAAISIASAGAGIILEKVKAINYH